MSSIITFFVVADDAVAAALAGSGPGADLAIAEYGNFDVWTTLTEWESLATGRDLDEVEDDGGADMVSDADEPVVLAFPPALTEALAAADAPALNRLASRWIELRAEEGEEIDEELANDLLGEVAGLAAEAVKAGASLYVWIC
ncbi:hypothetical protein FB565_007253 [Actinoplanes lutulentus]|uniref:DUF1877 family protein n=1 Tax=Actinoplanes lutulentus TaxID=1287878 RepID=A0A327Z110_9ACTN|nr:hypothetical protein [Actinoplanes lutulentus]MBB2947482.1 hypothetical protein [Actinoplanes lutulentus]RAK28088.1 hypothetical protein B0I29_121184 [Actinoplanes lutulentus]